MVGFGLIGLTGFLPNLVGLWGLTALGMHYVPAEILANQLGVAWNFLLIEHLLFRERRRHRRWWDRAGRFALLANADLVLRIPLIALFVQPVPPGRAVRHRARAGDDVRPALRRDRSAGLSAAPGT